MPSQPAPPGRLLDVLQILHDHALVHDSTNEPPGPAHLEEIAAQMWALVTPVGVAEIMACCGVSRRTVDKWRERCQFPAKRWKVGGRSAWDWADVEAWGRSTGRLREGGQWAMPGEMVAPSGRAPLIPEENWTSADSEAAP